MCGIVYHYNFDGTNASKRVLKQFKRQKHRGTTSFGFALPDKHKMSWKVKYEDIAKALKRTKNSEVLFHHRLSTSTADRPTSCHPFSTKDVFKTEFVGVHNGMLWNEHELYELHKERFGIRYVSDNDYDFNDSEAYVYDLASYFSGLTEGIEMTGYGAFVVIEFDKKTHERLRLHWGTTDASRAPLRVHHTKHHLDITSEGKGSLVEKDVHYVYDYKTGKISESVLVHKPLPYVSKLSPYTSGTYDSGYEDDYDIRSYSSVGDEFIDGDTDDTVPLWHDDEFLKVPHVHKGETMYVGGCCEYCDMRMEFFDAFEDIEDVDTESPESYDNVPIAYDESNRKLIEAIIVKQKEKV